MIPLSLLHDNTGSRVKRDRLELMTALVEAPGFDSLYRADVIKIPRRHPVYPWDCSVEGCERPRRFSTLTCSAHDDEWRVVKQQGMTRAEFLRNAEPLQMRTRRDRGDCVICVHRSAHVLSPRLCRSHWLRWKSRPSGMGLEEWMAGQSPLPAYGTCLVAVCADRAHSPRGLCRAHDGHYQQQGRPGGASMPTNWHRIREPAEVRYDDEEEFRRWCANADPVLRTSVLDLTGLLPLVKTEVQWGMYAHAENRNRSEWDLRAVQSLVNYSRRHRVHSLLDVGDDIRSTMKGKQAGLVLGEIADGLRCIYYGPSDAKDAGYIDTRHFGRQIIHTKSTIELTSITQRWLRDLAWDYMASLLQGPKCPRSRGPFDGLRRAATELSAFLEVDAPQGGHDPTQLRAEHAQRFVADQRHRARHTMTSLGMVRQDEKPCIVTDYTCRITFYSIRTLLHSTLASGEASLIGLDPQFIAAVPLPDPDPHRKRSPFTDEAARALADEANLQKLTDDHDPSDHGLRDVWEAIVYTGRRCSEVRKLRLDCIGRYGTLPMFWHDQTKVGNYDEGIRIPETLYNRLDERRRKTLIRFEENHARLPGADERTAMALFPATSSNPHADRSIAYTTFFRGFKTWVEGLDLGAAVPHQARHTLATNLMRAGASLDQIRRYLGHVSYRMAEHYTKISNSDLEDVLQTVWVAGPGTRNPGELLSGDSQPLTREEALALALDLSRRSTPADGGMCTFQPVVQGGACPWNLDCENCDKFVLTGADLLYWRRKQEQWRSIAERAPDDATADYLHQVFEPTARAIEGLEKALAGLGLLDQALAMDYRRPQDYFHRVWSTGFRAADLANLADGDTEPEQPPTETSR